MALLAKPRPRYRVAGDFSIRDPDGVECHFNSGDILPDEIAAMLPQAELDILLGRAMLHEVGAPKPVRQPEPAPKPPSAEEIIASYGFPTAGPRGVELQVLDRLPREKDLTLCTAPGQETIVVVHRLADGSSVATLCWRD